MISLNSVLIMMTTKKYRRLTILALMAFLPIISFGQEMLVGTYNIRNKNQSDSINGEVWSKRCQVIGDLVNFMSPVIFGTQEVLHGQLKDMLNVLAEPDTRK